MNDMETPNQLITPAHLETMRRFKRTTLDWTFDFLPEFVTAKSLSLVMRGEFWYPTLFQEPEMSHEEGQAVSLNAIRYTHELDRIFICIVGEEEFNRVFETGNVQDLRVRTEQP